MYRGWFSTRIATASPWRRPRPRRTDAMRREASTSSRYVTSSPDCAMTYATLSGCSPAWRSGWSVLTASLRGERVVVEVEPRRAPHRLDGRGRAQRDVPVLVEVVAVGQRAAVLPEDLVAPAAQHLGEVAVVGLARDLDPGRATLARVLEAAHDVVRLHLDEVEVRRAVVAARREDREHVREAGDADALVGLEAVLVPESLEVLAADAGRLDRGHVAGLEDLEAGGEDEDVDLVLDPVGGLHADRGDPLDRRRLQRDVVAVERREVGVVEARPLAAQPVLRRQLLPRLRIGDLRLEELFELALAELAERQLAPVVGGDREGQLDIRLAQQPRDPRPERQLEEQLPEALDRAGGLREAPDGRALEDGERFDGGRDLGDDLHRRRAGPDDRDPLVRQVHAVVPAGGVHHDPCVVVDARDIGFLRLGEHAGRADDVAGGERLAVGRLEAPDVVVLVEDRTLDPPPQPQPRAQAVLVDQILRVGLQLVARRVDARPVRALVEGELVAERRDVDGDARIRVPVPGPADALSLLDDDEVVEAGLVEFDGRADAGEPGPDHDDLVVGGSPCAHAVSLLSGWGRLRLRDRRVLRRVRGEL